MKYGNHLTDFATNPIVVLATFIVLLVLMDLLLVRWAKISDHSWKKVDYIWLGAAALGLLTTSAQADSILAPRYLENTTPAVVHHYKIFRSQITETVEEGMFACRSFSRTPYSPEDFDQSVAAYQGLCERVKAFHASLPAKVKPPFASLSDLGFEPLTGDERYVGWEVEMMNNYADNYETVRRLWGSYYEATERKGWELVAVILGPLIIAFALALRITKVTGELVNSKRSQT